MIEIFLRLGELYPNYAEKKKKEHLPNSEAEARCLERADEYPKSTKYGRQNPVTERWNGDEQHVLWRSAWADTVNRDLEELRANMIICS